MRPLPSFMPGRLSRLTARGEREHGRIGIFESGVRVATTASQRIGSLNDNYGGDGPEWK